MKKIGLVSMVWLPALTGPLGQGRRLEVLFLGDNGQHRPTERLPALMAGLGPRGVNLTYTDRLEDLNTDNLSRYDALLIYAHRDHVTPGAEKALPGCVSEGHGLVGLHCASYYRAPFRPGNL